MGRLVLLRHDTPDGSYHFDLMLERLAGDDRLMTFRLANRLSLDRASRAGAERLGEHRSAYLTYEGPVSGDRGLVRREWATNAELVEESGDHVRVRVEGGAQIVLRRVDSDWSVEVQPSDSQQPGMTPSRQAPMDAGGPEA